MKLIPLTQGKFAIVDDKNFEWFNQWKWYALRGKYTWYAVRNDYSGGKHRMIRMHREVLSLCYGDRRQADHIDHNGLNNQEYNLRVVTHQQNQFNRRNTRGYYWNKRAGKWMARIWFNGKEVYLGLFNNEEDARKAYLDAKEKYHIIRSKRCA